MIRCFEQPGKLCNGIDANREVANFASGKVLSVTQESFLSADDEKTQGCRMVNRRAFQP